MFMLPPSFGERSVAHTVILLPIWDEGRRKDRGAGDVWDDGRDGEEVFWGHCPGSFNATKILGWEGTYRDPATCMG